MMLLNYRFSLLSISGHIDFYPPVSVNISNLHPVFIPIQRGNHATASVNTTQYGIRSLKFTGPRLWNSLPTSITNSNSLRIFRKTLKNSMFNCYSIN